MVDLTNLKRSRPLLLIILILILVAGGGYYYLYLRKPKPTPPEEVTEGGFDYPRGTVERIEEGKIVIRTEDGLRELLVDEDTLVTPQAEGLYEVIHGDAGSLEDIEVGDEIGTSVKLFSDGTAKAFYIQILKGE